MEFAGFAEFCEFEEVDWSTIGKEFFEGFGCEGGGGERVAAGEECNIADGGIPIVMEHGCVTTTAPGRGDHLVYHFELHFAVGLKAIDVVLKDGIEAFLIFGEDESGLGVSAMFEAIEAIAMLALCGDWATGFAAIAASGIALFLSGEARPAFCADGRLS